MPTRPGQEERRTLYQSNKSLCHTSRWALGKHERSPRGHHALYCNNKKISAQILRPLPLSGPLPNGTKIFCKIFRFCEDIREICMFTFSTTSGKPWLRGHDNDCADAKSKFWQCGHANFDVFETVLDCSIVFLSNNKRGLHKISWHLSHKGQNRFMWEQL